MGFFDRFKRIHEVAPSTLPKSAKENVASVKKADEEVEEKRKKEAIPVSGGEDRGILLRPVVSEKATKLATLNQYVFVVLPHASKGAIKDAVQYRYGIAPIAVSVQRYQGKKVRYGRVYGMTKKYTKAIVTMPKGQSIDVLKAREKE